MGNIADVNYLWGASWRRENDLSSRTGYSIEQAVRSSSLNDQAIADAGCRVAHAVAGDNLRIGRTVIADPVPALQLTRDTWIKMANDAAGRAIGIEIKGSDIHEYRRPVETRTANILGLRLRRGEDLVSHEHRPWNREHIVMDTSDQTVNQNLTMLGTILPGNEFLHSFVCPAATALRRFCDYCQGIPNHIVNKIQLLGRDDVRRQDINHIAQGTQEHASA